MRAKTSSGEKPENESSPLTAVHIQRSSSMISTLSLYPFCLIVNRIGYIVLPAEQIFICFLPLPYDSFEDNTLRNYNTNIHQELLDRDNDLHHMVFHHLL